MWFAWYPVRLGSRDCRWLEKIWRKGTLHSLWSEVYWTWDYADGHDLQVSLELTEK